ncbi:Major facilitator superfamily domain-containing protein 6 [Seminavis robusta]|uniref:Major facilitator superfamily domain-containing protein 6 n=1 Tax=Seminavis robusta TaxID=568900 RepID=A0A9N8E248_9STRA|nr:Major facilitator superfamily domain-containing protein 6 [Seminavis robusta]|eukprot:Sro539_g162860.1 Major facilitator superfamily domain-containing protein 6 (488) ;mRNA; r:40099-41562
MRSHSPPRTITTTISPNFYLRDNNDDDQQYTLDTANDAAAPSQQGLLFFKTLYFLEGFSATNFGRFAVLYFSKEKNLSLTEIGTIQGVTPFAALGAQVFWGWLADEIQSRKTVMVICKFFSTVLLMSLAFPFVESFTTIFILSAAISAFRSTPVLDAHTMDLLGPPHATMYGTIRMWSAISMALGAVAVGQMTDFYGFAMDFFLYGSMMTLQLVALLAGLPKRTDSEHEIYQQLLHQHKEHDAKEIEPDDNDDTVVEASVEPHQYNALGDTLMRASVIYWLSEVSILWAGMSIVDSFLFVYMQQDLQASTLLCGYTVGVTVLCALPIFHYSKELLEWLGHDMILMLSMASFSTRVVGYSYLTPDTVQWILLLEILEGVTASCVPIIMVDYADCIAPKGWSTTIQSTVNAVIVRIGGGVGPLIAGAVMDAYGGRAMFQGLGILAGLLLYLHLTVMAIGGVAHDKFLYNLQEERMEKARGGGRKLLTTV